MFEALELATAMLDGGVAPLVLVAAVDSRVDTQTLAALANSNRLESSANLDGYIPGEAAACVLLGTASAVSPAQVLATIVGLARAREHRPLVLDPAGVATAEGLAALFRQLRHGFGARVDEVFAATTGERYYAQEFAHASLRNAALMPEPLRLCSIAASLGDLGAAAGAVALVRAVVRAGPSQAGNRNEPNAASLIYGSGDDGALGGCVLTSSLQR
jgi:3-oxoacyl-[acyl-carrier-protein] synthase-1